jgi:hypothetical protein
MLVISGHGRAALSDVNRCPKPAVYARHEDTVNKEPTSCTPAAGSVRQVIPVLPGTG